MEELNIFMKKLMLVMFVVLVAASFVAAQNYTSGTGLTGKDVLGAHNNGGRGCAGCHAPHSGAAGGGGNAVGYSGTNVDTMSGSNALFGQDVTPLFGVSLTFGGGFVEALPTVAAAYATQTDELRGIMMLPSLPRWPDRQRPDDERQVLGTAVRPASLGRVRNA
jgi:hypothetical protein